MSETFLIVMLSFLSYLTNILLPVNPAHNENMEKTFFNFNENKITSRKYPIPSNVQILYCYKQTYFKKYVRT